MAGIDKTYVNSWEDLKQIQDWSKTAYAVDGLGNRYRVYDWCNNMTQEEYNNLFPKEVCVWNTPLWLDIWLIRNCPLEIIQNRLKEQYASCYDDIKNHTSKFDTYKRNGLGRHIHFKTIGKSVRKKRTKSSWLMQCFDGFWYSEELDVWSTKYELVPYNTNTARINGHLDKRKLIRYLRKWNLPSGVRFILLNDNQIWEIITSE